MAAAPAAGEVTVDGGEITEHEWVRPADAIAARDEGRVTLLPPTWVTLWELARRETVAEVLAAAAGRREPPFFETHIAFLPREDDPAKQDVVVALGRRRRLRDRVIRTLPGAAPSASDG